MDVETLPTSDGVEVGIEGTVYFTLNTDEAVLRQLLAWERDFGEQAPAGQGGFDDRIYVFTPQAAVIELPAGLAGDPGYEDERLPAAAARELLDTGHAGGIAPAAFDAQRTAA